MWSAEADPAAATAGSTPYPPRPYRALRRPYPGGTARSADPTADPHAAADRHTADGDSATPDEQLSRPARRQGVIS